MNTPKATLRVLVVDDVSSVRALLCRLLGRVAQDEADVNFEFLEASDGEEALEFLEKESVDLIFLDLMMPRMDGFGFLEERRARAVGLDAPVVICSGFADLSALDRARTLGAGSLLRKPYDTEAVRERLLAALKALRQTPSVR